MPAEFGPLLEDGFLLQPAGARARQLRAGVGQPPGPHTRLARRDRRRPVLLGVALQDEFAVGELAALILEPAAEEIDRRFRAEDLIRQALLDVALRQRVGGLGREHGIGRTIDEMDDPAVRDGSDRDAVEKRVNLPRLPGGFVAGGCVDRSRRAQPPGDPFDEPSVAGVVGRGEALELGGWPAQPKSLERAPGQVAAAQHTGVAVLLNQELRAGLVDRSRAQAAGGAVGEHQDERDRGGPPPPVEHPQVIRWMLAMLAHERYLATDSSDRATFNWRTLR